MADKTGLPESRKCEEVEIGGQWFSRGNVSNAWFAVNRPGGNSLADRVPSICWPFLEEVARLRSVVSETGERALPDTSKEVHDTLIDAERYRWLRDECVYTRRVEIAEAATEDHLLDHHIDKGRCGL